MTEAPENTLLLTARETAKRLALCEKSVLTLAKRGDLPCVRIGRAVRFRLESVTRWAAERERLGEISVALAGV